MSEEKETNLTNMEKAVILIFALIGIVVVLNYFFPCRITHNCYGTEYNPADQQW